MGETTLESTFKYNSHLKLKPQSNPYCQARKADSIQETGPEKPRASVHVARPNRDDGEKFQTSKMS